MLYIQRDGGYRFSGKSCAMMSRMTPYEQLELLVRMTYSDEVKTLEDARSITPAYMRDFPPPDAVDMIARFVDEHAPPEAVRHHAFYSLWEEVSFGRGPIVALASLSSLPTIKEAWEDYLKTS